jgi:uncharacterized RmlC-like cupin family protein
MAQDVVEVVHAADRSLPEVVTEGMERQQAWADGRVWLGTVRTQPGVATGWHHHGEYESWIHVISGHARMEFGPAGRSVEIAGPGDVIHVPAWVVHRELTDGSEPVEAVLFRVGTGQVTFNTHEPAAD